MQSEPKTYPQTKRETSKIEGVSARTWLSPFLENLRYYHIKVRHNKNYNLIYSLLYLPTSLALEMMFYQIVSMWLSPMTIC